MKRLQACKPGAVNRDRAETRLIFKCTRPIAEASHFCNPCATRSNARGTCPRSRSHRTSRVWSPSATASMPPSICFGSSISAGPRLVSHPQFSPIIKLRAPSSRPCRRLATAGNRRAIRGATSMPLQTANGSGHNARLLRTESAGNSSVRMVSCIAIGLSVSRE